MRQKKKTRSVGREGERSERRVVWFGRAWMRVGRRVGCVEVWECEIKEVGLRGRYEGVKRR